jgi:hypothetical protein
MALPPARLSGERGRPPEWAVQTTFQTGSEQTIVFVVWLASDHMHLYIDATPDYALDEIVHTIREHLEHALTHLFPALRPSHQPA